MSTSEPVGAPRAAGRGVPAIWGNVPQRNKNFTGREDLLVDLRRRITDEEVTALLPHALHGMGGVGKTQLAIEYAYRYQGDYDIVWWIPADQETLVRSTLAALAPRLNLTDVASGRIQDALNAVLDALRRGEPYRRWLLVFDNADQPEPVRALMPHGPGHVLVTSRNHRWEGLADTVEVDVFTRAESVLFLRRRVSHIAEQDDDRLANEVGDLPLALEQAGAMLAETAMSVDTYLGLLKQEAGKILGESPPSDYPVPVAAAWSLSVQRIRSETPHAMDLLRRCAFFGPEPISMELLDRARYVLGPPLKDVLSDPIVISRTVRSLGRYALARIDNLHKTLQVHRLIQKLLRDELTAEESGEIRHEVHLLLAAADPGDPDEFANWLKYADLLAHAGPSLVLECREPDGRRLARNLVRWLYVVGDFSTAQTFAEEALARWTADSGEDDADVLMMSRHLGNVLFARSYYHDAYALNKRTLERMRRVLGVDHEETLMLTNSYGADLRARGEFNLARELDEASIEMHRAVFGEDHPRTFMAINNLAVDYRITSAYSKALALQIQNYQDRLDFYGRDDHPRVLYALDHIARAQRHAGQYAAARETAERVYRDYEELVRQRVLPKDHPWVLGQANSLSIARRKVGAVSEGLELAEKVYEMHKKAFGVNHPDTLDSAINLGNTQRVVGNFDTAAALINSAMEGYKEVLGTDHPYTQSVIMNLAVILRLQGHANKARTLLDDVLRSLERMIGSQHDYTLICATNLASALADVGEIEKAREQGEQTLELCRATLGENHPHTLACAANLALDLRALGHEKAAAKLAADTLTRYQETLGKNHTTVVATAEGQRIDLDIEPLPL